jgi:benzoyl-CoA 2,3-dioxygenase component B
MTGSMDYRELIPNNVDLRNNRKLLKALESWHPGFMQWWMDRGPVAYQENQIYLRTAVSVDTSGWAVYDYVRMPEYRWGIFLAPVKGERRIHFGDAIGENCWEDVPGEYRNELRRLIVTQGDTEPGSVEQQRALSLTAPSLYDMRNLFQVNVEEARHLWAMVYLLHNFFGRDGRDEADEMLARCSGDADSPRILSTFNDPVEDWLDFFCFTTYTDRDGKYQLGSLAESAFTPLSQTTRFMLTEEAHHLFVGETGLARTLRRSAQLMRENESEDVKPYGAIPIDIVQKYMNYWYSVSLDLFGSENSSNAANYFSHGLKGRFNEANRKLYPDPSARDGAYHYEIYEAENGHVVQKEIPMRRAMNAILRDAYIQDCQRAVARWNKIRAEEGCAHTVKLPSVRFHRVVGSFAQARFDPDGNQVTDEQWARRKDEWLPTAADRAYVKSTMFLVTERGKFANWIAPPARGIHGRPIEFEYVRL